MVTVINAEGSVVGRMATHIAKLLLKGEEVAVVNVEKAIITGSPRFTSQKFRQRLARGKGRKGPWYPSRPDRIFKRVVRGMLPYQQAKGRNAMKLLRCYHGVPKRFASAKSVKVEGATSIRTARFMTLKELSEALGVTVNPTRR